MRFFYGMGEEEGERVWGMRREGGGCIWFRGISARQNADSLLCITGIAQTTLEESDEEEDE